MIERKMETEKLIAEIKEVFETELIRNLCLTKVDAPLYLTSESGLNDNLNGVERPVTFLLGNTECQIVHSLAKWKRWYLGELDAKPGEGIVANMIAIRADEILTDIHSNLVDQWDWEKVINQEKRTMTTLIEHGTLVFEALKTTEEIMGNDLPTLPNKLTIIHTEDLYQKYPYLSPKEREHMITKDYGAVLLIGIGGVLSNGEVHDLRAPDYDDWSTKDEQGRSGLNADLIVWNPISRQSLEISSMGIRVDEMTMEKQLKECDQESRKHLPFHSAVLNKKLPYTIGGGIGKSRVTMFIMKRKKISTVQPLFELASDRRGVALD